VAVSLPGRLRTTRFEIRRIDVRVTPSVFESLLERGHNLRCFLDLRQPITEDCRRAVILEFTPKSLQARRFSSRRRIAGTSRELGLRAA